MRGCGVVADAGLVARAREVVGSSSWEARSTRVRGTVVTGIPRQTVASSLFERRVRTPLTRRFFGVVTSGAGGFPFTTPSR